MQIKPLFSSPSNSNSIRSDLIPDLIRKIAPYNLKQQRKKLLGHTSHIRTKRVGCKRAAWSGLFSGFSPSPLDLLIFSPSLTERRREGKRDPEASYWSLPVRVD
jgi:hypothetical protein